MVCTYKLHMLSADSSSAAKPSFLRIFELFAFKSAYPTGVSLFKVSMLEIEGSREDDCILQNKEAHSATLCAVTSSVQVLCEVLSSPAQEKSKKKAMGWRNRVLAKVRCSLASKSALSSLGSISQRRRQSRSPLVYNQYYFDGGPILQCERRVRRSYSSLILTRCTDSFRYVEGIVRGYRNSLLTGQNYNNLTQCENIDGMPCRPPLYALAHISRCQITAVPRLRRFPRLTSPKPINLVPSQ